VFLVLYSSLCGNGEEGKASRLYKHAICAALLFLILGLKMLREGRGMDYSEKVDEGMPEAEEEIDVDSIV